MLQRGLQERCVCVQDFVAHLTCSYYRMQSRAAAGSLESRKVIQ